MKQKSKLRQNKNRDQNRFQKARKEGKIFMKYKTVPAMSFIVGICLIFVLCVSATPYDSWYCVRQKEHRQPKCDSKMRYIEDYDGYYIDHTHTEDSVDKVVYLTFDAGYENGNVEKILNTLKEENVCGAFFILGNLIERNGELVRRMAEEGHIVANHTYSHRDMTKVGSDAFGEELQKLSSAYKELTGKDMPLYFRPPEGKFSREMMENAKNLGYKTIFWSFAYADWDNGKQPDYASAKKKILDNIHNGEIILLHPTSSTNAAVLGDVIKELKSEGYRFGSLNELTA